MIKGVYNENEFYTNFYWDSKFLEDLRTKIGADPTAEAGIATLKSLDSQFWSLKEMSEGDPKRVDALVLFYRSLFQALGYSSDAKDHQTSAGQFMSLFVDVSRANTPELYALLLEKSESGTFESPPVFIGAQNASEIVPVDCELSEVLQEELLESQNPPRWILVGAPNSLFIVERNKWSFGRYLRIEWQEVFLQRDSKPYELLYGLAAKRFLCPDSGSSPHDEFDENSHRHAYEVTTELRESVREAVELLINEMIDQRKEGHQKIYSPDKADDYARELTHDALYYVYRLLFLLYLEAQGDDSELLPLKSEIYRNGYSLEKLLELDYVDIAPNSAESRGHFLFESLEQIFNLIYFGFEPVKEGIFENKAELTGFLVRGIKSDLFDPNAVKHLKGTKLRNGVLLDILKKLSLTRRKERGGRPRARVSYANLGINQLGAVYEGLLSYTGFFAQEELHALKPTSIKQSEIDSGKELDQVYLAPKSLVDKYRRATEKKYKITDENIVFDENGNPKIYKKGSFVYRLAGRDRQKLASFYTPESLTKCTVKYSLKVLFENKRSLADLWKLKILEPAMGSGAFLNEAVNQIADKILECEVQQTIGDLRSPKAKQKRLSDIKYELIAKNVFGVDLNPTAIELARFSLWLNCIGAGKEPPSFEGRLRLGNSLVGAYFKKGADGVYSWLLVDDSMLDYGKKYQDYNADGAARLKAFRADLLGSRLKSSDSLVVTVQRRAEELFQVLASGDVSSKKIALERLKWCCDLWCSAFFLSPEDLSKFPPSHKRFLETIDTALKDGPVSVGDDLQNLIVRKTEQERFFHWELEFFPVVSNGGFDLILGNPPWVAVEWQDSIYVSDYNAVPSVVELNAADTRTFVKNLDDGELKNNLAKQYLRVAGYSQMLGTSFYKKLEGVQKNTYKAFDVLGFYLLSQNGAFGIIQEDGVLEDKSGEDFRRDLYARFKFHFQFQNEKFLFAEVGHAKRFSANIFSGTATAPDFVHIGNLFLPSTIDQCFLDTEGTSSIPLIKDQTGSWDVGGHQKRIIKITDNTLQAFSKYLSEDTKSPVFLNLHSQPLLGFIEKIGRAEETFESYLGSENCAGSAMFDESGAQDSGYIAPRSARPKDVSGVVLSGPHINTGNPLSQETQSVYRSKFSYDSIDLENVSDDFVQRTLYQLEISSKEVDALFPELNGKPYRSYFRLVTRGMVNPTNERCLFSVIIPPSMSHINGIKGIASITSYKLAVVGGLATTLILDGFLRIKNKTNMFPDDIKGFPIGPASQYLPSIGRRALALNGLTEFYEPLWKSCNELKDDRDSLISGTQLKGFGGAYRRENALRATLLREQAMIEIDALAALNFELSEEELVQIYEVLFPVLNMYDRERAFDRKEKLKEAHRYFKRRGW